MKMKKISCLFITLLMVLFCCTAMAEGVATTWTLESIAKNGQTINAADIGMGMTFVLNADGTGSAVAVRGEETEEGVCEWSVNGNVVTLTVEGDPMDFTLNEEGKLVGEMDGVTMTLVSGTAAAPATAASGLEAFDGSWVCYNASYQGETIPLTNINAELTMTMSNGTGEMWMIMEGTEYESVVTGELKEVVITEGEAPVEALVVTAENPALFSDEINMVYMEDGTIHFVEPGSGVTFILEKVGDVTVDNGLASFDGSWVCYNASYQGETIPLTNINAELTMTMSNGTGEMWMIMEGTEYESVVTGELKEVVITEGEAAVEALVVTAENPALFSDEINMVYMEDGTIHFVEPSSGVTFILEKVAQ